LVAMRVSYTALGAQIADRTRTLKDLFLNP
jgi:hypothetical protein